MLIKVMYSIIFFSVFLKVLLSKGGTPSASATRSGSGLWVPFVPQTSIVKWAKRKTPLRIQVSGREREREEQCICMQLQQRERGGGGNKNTI